MLRVSYSAVQDWRACQQRYAYRHIDKIQPKIRQAAPELGTIIHAYFEHYYAALYLNRDSKTSHRSAVEAVLSKKMRAEIQAMAALADGLGSEDEAKTLLRIPITAKRLLTAYHRVRGAHDAGEHKVLLVEQSFELEFAPGIILPGKIDLLTETSHGIWLWEHKTTGNIPSQKHRFRDLQTLIYKVAIEELYGHELAGVIWNYVHTRPPQMPRVLQNGTLSTAKNQTTTVDLYRRAVKKADCETSEAFLRQLERKEREQMFPRHTLPLAQAEEVLLRDYATSVQEIGQARRNKDFVPVRNVSQQCDWCPYLKLCQAAVLGGDTAQIQRLHFQ